MTTCHITRGPNITGQKMGKRDNMLVTFTLNTVLSPSHLTTYFVICVFYWSRHRNAMLIRLYNGMCTTTCILYRENYPWQPLLAEVPSKQTALQCHYGNQAPVLPAKLSNLAPRIESEAVTADPLYNALVYVKADTNIGKEPKPAEKSRR